MQGAYNVPLDGDGAESLAIQRRLKLADALRQQSMSPLQGQMVGNQYVAANPLQHIARAMNGYIANKEEGSAIGEANQYAQDKRARLAQALSGVDMSKPGALYEAGMKILSDNPQLAGQLITGGIGNDRMQAGFEHQDRNQEKLFQHQDEASVQARMDAEAARQDQRDWQAEQNRLSRENTLALKEAGGAGSPYFTPIYTPNGVYGFNARSGDAAPVMGPDGKPLVRANDDPTLAGQLGEAKGRGQALGKGEAANQLAEPAAAADRKKLLDNIGELEDHPGFDSIFGTIAGATPDVRQNSVDARAAARQVLKQLTVENRQKLKGQGSVTDFETKMLEEAATKLSNPRISADEARKELEKLRGFLVNPPPRVGVSPGTPGAPAADHSQMSDDELKKALGLE